MWIACHHSISRILTCEWCCGEIASSVINNHKACHDTIANRTVYLPKNTIYSNVHIHRQHKTRWARLSSRCARGFSRKISFRTQPLLHETLFRCFFLYLSHLYILRIDFYDLFTYENSPLNRQSLRPNVWVTWIMGLLCERVFEVKVEEVLIVRLDSLLLYIIHDKECIRNFNLGATKHVDSNCWLYPCQWSTCQLCAYICLLTSF